MQEQKRLSSRWLWAVMVAALSSGGCAMHAVGSGKVAVTPPASATAAPRFSDRERGLIRDYFRRKAEPTQAPVAVRLVPGERLAERIAMREFPSELEFQLVRLPSGYARVLVGRDAVLIERERRTVLDIVYSVLPPP